jgi:hypothetical protein
MYRSKTKAFLGDPALRHLPLPRLNREASESRSTATFKRDPRTGLIISRRHSLEEAAQALAGLGLN